MPPSLGETHGNSLQIPRFSTVDLMKKPFTMCVCARRNSGKSSFIKDMLYRLNQGGFPRCVVFSGTEEGNEAYSAVVPKAYVHGGVFQIEKLQKIVNTQRAVIKACKRAETNNINADLDTRLLIVLDDLMFKKGLTRNDLFSELFFNGRHWNISLIISSQYVMSLDIACRGNVDYLVLFKEQVPRNRAKLHEEFFGVFENKRDFCRVLDACTANYGCLVLDNTKSSMSIADTVNWYRAQFPLPFFVFGNATFKRHATKNRPKND